MEQIKNEKELIKRLKIDIDTCGKSNILFLAGHFPLVYSRENIEAFDQWGVFSTYSLELACKVAKYARKKKKKVGFVFFVDDHMYQDRNVLSKAQVTAPRRNLYKLRSGFEAVLPNPYKKIMKKYVFSEKDVLRQNQERPGRDNCLYFSEKILRASKRQIDNACAREYIEFLGDTKYFDKDTTYMIAFVPNRCKENVCHFGLDVEIQGLSASHVFMETMGTIGLEPKQLYTKGRGVTYRKD